MNIKPTPFPNQITDPGGSSDDEEKGPPKKKRKLESSFLIPTEQPLPPDPLQLLSLSDRVKILEAQTQSFEWQAQKIEDEIASPLFDTVMADRESYLAIANQQTPPITPPSENEPFHEPVISLENLFSRVNQSSRLLKQVVRMIKKIEQTIKLKNREVTETIRELSSGSLNSDSTEFQEGLEIKLKRKLRIAEDTRASINEAMKTLLFIFTLWQIWNWEKKVFDDREAIQLLTSSFKLVKMRQEQESEKKGLSNFTIPQVAMQSQTTETMAAVSFQSIRKGSKTVNQDRYFHSTFPNDLACFGVCDGHGNKGELVAEAISTSLPKLLEAALSKLDTLSYGSLVTVIRQTFRQMDQELVKYQTSGSTLTCIIQTPIGFLVANTGDSRTVLDRQGTAVQCTADQLASDPYFAKAVEERGAKVQYLQEEKNGPLRVLPVGTMITSDMGNHKFRSYGIKMLTCVPEITFFPIEEIIKGDSFFIIASDGLGSFVNSNQLVETFRKRLKICSNLQTIAQELSAACYHNGGKRFLDDTTVMIVQL